MVGQRRILADNDGRLGRPRILHNGNTGLDRQGRRSYVKMLLGAAIRGAHVKMALVVDRHTKGKLNCSRGIRNFMRVRGNVAISHVDGEKRQQDSNQHYAKRTHGSLKRKRMALARKSPAHA
jgi:hypothetical protein